MKKSDLEESQKLWKIVNKEKRIEQLLNSAQIYDADVQVAVIGLQRKFSEEAIKKAILLYHERDEWEFGETEDQRRNFFANVIAEARGKIAEKELEKMTRSGEGSQEHAKNFLSLALRVDIERMIHRGGRGGSYEIILNNELVVNVGPAESILSYRKVAAAFFDSGIAIPTIKNFKVISDNLLKIVEHVETTSEEEETIEWLAGFVGGMRSNPINLYEPSGDRDLALEKLSNGHFSALKNIDGSYYICLPAFLKYVRVVYQVPLNQKSIGARLSRIGFFKDRTSFRDANDKVRQLRVWISGTGFEKNI
jgi:hypothetical protein